MSRLPCDGNDAHKSGDDCSNMGIVRLNDHDTTYRCHCGREFTWATGSADRPTCPDCECAYFKGLDDYKLLRRKKLLDAVPKPPEKFKFFAAYVEPDTGIKFKLSGGKGLDHPDHLVTVGPALSLYDFTMKVMAAGMERKADLLSVAIYEIDEERYLDLLMELIDRQRKGLLGVLSKFLGIFSRDDDED